jgi:hypothetical protein
VQLAGVAPTVPTATMPARRRTAGLFGILQMFAALVELSRGSSSGPGRLSGLSSLAGLSRLAQNRHKGPPTVPWCPGLVLWSPTTVEGACRSRLVINKEPGDAMNQKDSWSPDEPLGTETFEQGDEALDEASRIDPD